MIIKHKLKIYSETKAKLAFIKILKEFTGCGLKAAKYVADLSPGSDYFDVYRTYESDEPLTIEGHIEWLKKYSNFYNITVTNDWTSVSFDMDTHHTENLRASLNELSIEFTLDGLSELRDQKIRDILS